MQCELSQVCDHRVITRVPSVQLWGLIRQGFKCRVCSINAHKHCKDMVVMECRPKQHSDNGRDSSSHAVTSRRRFRRKKKSSVSESESSPPSPKCSVASMASQGSHSSQGSGPGSSTGERDREEAAEASDGGAHAAHATHGHHVLHGAHLSGSLPSSPQPVAMWGPSPRRKIR